MNDQNLCLCMYCEHHPHTQTLNHFSRFLLRSSIDRFVHILHWHKLQLAFLFFISVCFWLCVAIIIIIKNHHWTRFPASFTSAPEPMHVTIFFLSYVARAFMFTRHTPYTHNIQYLWIHCSAQAYGLQHALTVHSSKRILEWESKRIWKRNEISSQSVLVFVLWSVRKLPVFECC